jgi:hypothetical protein
LDKYTLYFDLVFLLFERKMSSVFVHHDAMCAGTVIMFKNDFKTWYDKKRRDFFGLVVESIQYLDSLIRFNAWPREIQTPAVVESNSVYVCGGEANLTLIN